MNKVLRNPLAYIIFIVPALIFYAVFYLYPMLSTIKFAFTSWDGFDPNIKFNGVDNFIRAFQDGEFWNSVTNNLYFILFSIFIQVPIIVIFSIFISEVKLFRGFYKTTVFLPSILSTAVVGVLWIYVVYNNDIGLLNKILIGLGLEDWILPWLADERTAMLSILLTNAWQWTGFYIVLVLAAIFSIPRDVYEAADIDGATGFQKARFITVPLIRPILTVVILLSIVGAMKALDIVMVMTNGGPAGMTDVMATYMYRVGFKNNEYGYANTIGLLIFIFTLVITLINHFISKKLGEVEN